MAILISSFPLFWQLNTSQLKFISVLMVSASALPGADLNHCLLNQKKKKKKYFQLTKYLSKY